MALPLPKSLQKKNSQTTSIQKNQNQTNQNYSENQNDNQESQQDKLIKKYNEGSISLQEFQKLFPEFLTKTKYGGINQTKSVQEYIAYRSSKGLSTSEAEKSLPQSGTSYTSYGAKKSSSFVGNIAGEGGYSIASGGTGYNVVEKPKPETVVKTFPASFGKDVYITSKGNFVQQTPASFPVVTGVPASSPEAQQFVKKPQSTNPVLNKNINFQKEITLEQVITPDYKKSSEKYDNVKIAKTDKINLLKNVDSFIEESEKFVSKGKSSSEKIARKNLALGFIGSASAGLIGSTVGVISLARNPSKTVSGVVGLGSELSTKSGVEVGLKLAKEQTDVFFENPAFFAGGFLGSELFFRAGGKAFERTLVKPNEFKIIGESKRETLSGLSGGSTGLVKSTFVGTVERVPSGLSQAIISGSKKGSIFEQFVKSPKKLTSEEVFTLGKSKLEPFGKIAEQEAGKPSFLVDVVGIGKTATAEVKPQAEVLKASLEQGLEVRSTGKALLENKPIEFGSTSKQVSNDFSGFIRKETPIFPGGFAEREVANRTGRIGFVERQGKPGTGEALKVRNKNVKTKVPDPLKNVVRGSAEFTQEASGTKVVSGYYSGFQKILGKSTVNRTIKGGKITLIEKTVTIGKKGTKKQITEDILGKKTSVEIDVALRELEKSNKPIKPFASNKKVVEKISEEKITTNIEGSPGITLSEGLVEGKTSTTRSIGRGVLEETETIYSSPSTITSIGESLSPPSGIVFSSEFERSLTLPSQNIYSQPRGILFSDNVKEKSSLGNKSFISSNTRFSTSPISKPFTRPTSVPLTRPITTPLTKPITRPVTRPITSPLSTPITRPITKPITSPITTPVTTPITRPITQPVTSPITTPITRPITSPINFPLSKPFTQKQRKIGFSSEKQYLKKNIEQQAFGVFTKIRGKEKRLPGVYTKSDAFAKGTRILQQTLRASFKIKPIGTSITTSQNIRPANIPLYYSKRGFFVQKRESRLGSVGERKEIKLFKKTKKTRSVFL